MNDTTPNPAPGDQTVPAHSVPPVSSGMYGQGAHLLQTGMMLPPQSPGAMGTIGKYQIIRILGEGGMGQVLLAREPVTDSMVAIKLIKAEYLNKSWAVHRFLTEARHMYRMSHGAIIRVLDVSDRPEGPYFVMPFMAGGSLADKIKPGEPLPPETVLPIARAVAEALQHAHTRGITHRDLKPSNILLDSDGTAHLADFGLLRTFLNDTIIDTSQPQMEGTVPYMSPAVAAGKAEDTRCDIYAFGCLLYEMLTGQPPYQGPTVDAVLKQIQDGPPPPIRQLNPHAPAALTAIADHAMARELRDRYASMADVVAELERVAQGKEPIGTHGMEKSSSSKRKALIAAGIVALIGLTAFGISRLDWKHDDKPPGIAPTVPPQENLAVDLGDGVTMDFVLIRPGSFTMGSDKEAHKVTLTKPYYLGKYEVTQAQWEKLMGSNPSNFKGAKKPVEMVSWNDCQNFLAKLQEKVPGQTFRLPTQAEWEYACRAGSAGEYCYGDGEGSLAEYAWYAGYSGSMTHPVGGKKPNAWGLYDMHGNVYERCADWFGGYPSGSLTDPTGPETGFNRVNCGGSWYYDGWHCRLAARSSDLPDARNSDLGFRVAAVPAGGVPVGAEVPAPGANPPPVVPAPPKTDSTVPVSGVPAPNANPPAPLVEGPFSYTVKDGAITIVKYTGPGGDVKIPDKIKDMPVTEIGKSAFYSCVKLTRVALPGGLIRLGDGAFDHCVSLDDVEIPSTVTDIGSNAFNYCGALTRITIPASVTRIGYRAFSICTSLPTIKIPDGVTSIGDRAFYGCSSMVDVSIPNSVTSIGGNAFLDCIRLPRVTIPASVTAIGPGPVSGCSALVEITVDEENSVYCSVDGVLFDKKNSILFQCPEGKAGICKIPANFTKIGPGAFKNCAKLTGITIPDSVAEISSGAFVGCKGLSSIHIPASVSSIGVYLLFSGCNALTAIMVDAANPLYSSADGVLFNKQKTVLIRCPGTKAGSYEISGGVTKINPYAFADCPNLTGIMIPETVTEIGDQAFLGCGGLMTITVPARVSQIGPDAFLGCNKLVSITVDAANHTYCGTADGVLFNKDKTKLVRCPPGKAGTYVVPDGVTSIESQAFGDCANLTDITIPDSVNQISDDYVFSGCSLLTRVEIGKGLRSIGKHAFYPCVNLTWVVFSGDAPTGDADVTIFLRCNSATVCCLPQSKGWGKTFASRLTALWDANLRFCYTIDKDGVTLIGYIGSGGDVTIPDKINGLPVTTIAESAFQNCTTLTSLTVSEGVKNIIGRAFDGCSGLTKVALPASVISLGTFPEGRRNPFVNCPKLTSITVAAANPAYQSNADGILFNKEMTALLAYPGARAGSYTIPDNITTVGLGAFVGCVELTDVKVHRGVTALGSFAGARAAINPFTNCPKLISITVDETNATYCSGADGVIFSKDKSALVCYPSGKAGAYTVPDGVTCIEKEAFASCPRLNGVTLPASVTSIGQMAFINSGELMGVYFKGNAPDNANVGWRAFHALEKTTIYYLPTTKGWGKEFRWLPTAVWERKKADVPVPAAP